MNPRERDTGDVLDRWSIAKLKSERIGTEDNKKEFESFILALNDIRKKYPYFDWPQICDLMLFINDSIWQLESGLKSGKEELKEPYYILSDKNEKPLSKIGATTILIRNFNHIRVQFKNLINKLTNEGFQDIKKSHLSE